MGVCFAKEEERAHLFRVKVIQELRDRYAPCSALTARNWTLLALFLAETSAPPASFTGMAKGRKCIHVPALHTRPHPQLFDTA